MTLLRPMRMDGSSTAGRRAIKAVNVAHAGCDLAVATYYEVARMLVGRLTTTWSKRLGAADGINTGVNISRPFEQHDNPGIS